MDDISDEKLGGFQNPSFGFLQTIDPERLKDDTKKSSDDPGVRVCLDSTSKTNTVGKMTFFNHLLAVFGTLLVLAGSSRGADSFLDKTIVRPAELDAVGLNVVVGVSACVGLFVVGVMAAIFYHLVMRSRRFVCRSIHRASSRTGQSGAEHSGWCGCRHCGLHRGCGSGRLVQQMACQK
ncbi:hypothetical protein Bbelb_089800 [Branchiostoma belcheri]|nr:hypothetical protein Bbelb_089800 [Branchiostoma belcheri]